MTGANMFAYCGNDPVNRLDCTGYIPKAIGLGVITMQSEFAEGPVNRTYLAKQKPNMQPRKDKRKGSEDRQPTGERERNVAHPNGEEHSRVPKGPKGTRKIEDALALGGLTIAIIVLVADNVTGVGVADDGALVTLTTLWFVLVSDLFNIPTYESENVER